MITFAFTYREVAMILTVFLILSFALEFLKSFMAAVAKEIKTYHERRALLARHAEMQAMIKNFYPENFGGEFEEDDGCDMRARLHPDFSEAQIEMLSRKFEWIEYMGAAFWEREYNRNFDPDGYSYRN